MSNSSQQRIPILHRLYGVWFIAIFALLSLVTGILVMLIPGQHNRRKMIRMGARVLFRLTGAWPEIEGLEQLPRDVAAVVVANHSSYLDGLLLTAVLPHRFQFVIKREITNIPGVHFYLRRVGAHFVDRFDAHKGAADARRIMQSATAGSSLAFFPEGTFRREPGLRRFQNGAFTIATRQQLPLVPITINGTRTMLPAHSWLPRPAALQVFIHSTLTTDRENTPVTARDICRKAILSKLTEPDLLTTAD